MLMKDCHNYFKNGLKDSITYVFTIFHLKSK